MSISSRPASRCVRRRTLSAHCDAFRTRPLCSNITCLIRGLVFPPPSRSQFVYLSNTGAKSSEAVRRKLRAPRYCLSAEKLPDG